MNKTLSITSALFVATLSGQAAFAESAPPLTKDTVQSATQDYLLSYNEQAQPRRSALFAQILDSMSQNSTLASATESPTTPSTSTTKATLL